MLRAYCLILCLVAASQQLSITDFAVPSAVKIGENAELQCRHNVGEGESEARVYAKWWWTPLEAQSDSRQIIYQRIPDHEPETHHKNITIRDNDTIELLDLQPRDSGIYECEVSDVINEQRQHQVLTVYTQGTGPQLNLTREEDGPDEDDEEDIVVTCEASDVAPEPELMITVNGEMIADTELVNQTADGVYSIFANATLNKSIESGDVIRCELFFTDEKVTHEAYVDSLTYDNSGDEASTTQAPEDTTVWDTTTDSLQNNTSGSTLLSRSWVALVAIALPVQLIALQ